MDFIKDDYVNSSAMCYFCDKIYSYKLNYHNKYRIPNCLDCRFIIAKTMVDDCPNDDYDFDECREQDNYCMSCTICPRGRRDASQEEKEQAERIIQEMTDECPVCLKDAVLIELPTCVHKVCIPCCKTIYFGTAREGVERPIQLNEMSRQHPRWEITQCDEFTRREHMFELNHFCHWRKTPAELIAIRNNRVNNNLRPNALYNDRIYLYESELIKYKVEERRVIDAWDDYQSKKCKGNGLCPLCRSEPDRSLRING
jgi:hypothetical protein